ncbi:MAG: ABC-2 family transporter protein [Bdellovibrionota bacterium]
MNKDRKIRPVGWRLGALINGFQDAAAYRGEYFLELLTAAVVPAAIQWLLWYSVFKQDGATDIAGMNYEDMVHYTLFSILFMQVRGGNQDFELAEMIRSGGLSNYLLRPMGVVEFVYLRGVSPKLMIAALCLVVGMIAAPFVGLNPLRMVGAMALALVGNVIHYQIGAALSSVSFYWEEAYAVLMVKNTVVKLLSGEMIPLSVFPENWQWVWKATPFYLYVFGPTQYALGKWTREELAWNLLIGVGWIMVAAATVKVSWRVGIKRYLSLGG